MRKLLLLLITLITINNPSYASFPVSGHIIPTETLETSESPNYADNQPIWGVLSLIFAFLGLISLSNPYAMLILSLLSVISAIIGLTNKASWMEITGLILGVIITIISGGISALLFLFRDA